jgi:hypothetical protein
VVWPQNHSDSFRWFGLKRSGNGFSRFGLKTSEQFLCLGLKTKWASVYRLCHKTDGGRLAWDMRRDLVGDGQRLGGHMAHRFQLVMDRGLEDTWLIDSSCS